MTSTDLAGRNYLVTGANTGIGKETARALAQRGGRVTLAGRSEEKTRAAIADIAATAPGAQLEYLRLDLGSHATVRESATEFLARDEPLDVLINNAGMAGLHGTTVDGFEMAFGTNHVGPFLFTQLLLERLKASEAARVVNVASDAHYRAKGIDWDAVRQPTVSKIGFAEYGVSKLANVLHAQELGRRLAGTSVTTYALHPGVIASDVWRETPQPLRSVLTFFMKSTADGAKTSLHCATSDAAGQQSGLYYEKSKPKTPSPAVTPELAAELWERTEAWVAQA
jgi:NAD(P)-dependent dehydrogenase (short-subunit alcohol dehydrogenase family)